MTTIPLWPAGAVPFSVGDTDADIPTLTIYEPTDVPRNGKSVVVCPGGGYCFLAPHEGEPVALWLTTLGYTAAVLKYRIAPRYRHPAPHTDVTRAIRTLRARAEEWKLDPSKIGVLGFSAGGHLAGSASTHFDAGDPAAADPIERVSSRPDASILIYPVILSGGIAAHGGSRSNLFGGDSPSQELIDWFSLDERITKDTPPAFLVHSTDDKGVPIENSLRYALALEAAGVPFGMQVYPTGGHGYGLGIEGDPLTSSWPAACAAWLSVAL